MKSHCAILTICQHTEHIGHYELVTIFWNHKLTCYKARMLMFEAMLLLMYVDVTNSYTESGHHLDNINHMLIYETIMYISNSGIKWDPNAFYCFTYWNIIYDLIMCTMFSCAKMRFYNVHYCLQQDCVRQQDSLCLHMNL